MKRISKATMRKFAELSAAVLVSLADRRVTPNEGAVIILKARAFIAALLEDLTAGDADDADDDAS
ncbi:MAG: hypothetical protein EBZ78_09770 [Verrucomicrobia bacterium]|nr:hypothetical protein [Verrucomicrobiota bacterium]